MKSVLYYMMPYAPCDLMAIRVNDDDTYGMRTLIGTYDDEYGPEKKRPDTRSWRPYVTTKDFKQTEKVLDRIRADCIGSWMDSAGYNFGGYNQKVYSNREFVQAGYNDKGLWIVTMKKHYEGDPIDCRVAVINRQERVKTNILTKEPYISPIGGYSYHRFEEVMYLKEDALTIIGRPTANKMALELFEKRWETRLDSFKEWCGVSE